MAIADSLITGPQDIPTTIKDALSRLAPIYEQSRYPSGNVDDPIPLDAIEAGEAQDALKASEDVMTWVRQLLQEPPGKRAPKTN